MPALPASATRQTRVIHLRADAPAMPAPAAPCNGCGVCCAHQPCPLGMLVSGRRQGRCRALAWDGTVQMYRCRMISRPGAVWRWWPAWAHPLLSRAARRWISSASGCDAQLEIQRPV